jgi:hypothetical protein
MAKGANLPTVRTAVTPKLTPPGGMRLTTPKLTLGTVMGPKKAKVAKPPKIGKPKFSL